MKPFSSFFDEALANDFKADQSQPSILDQVAIRLMVKDDLAALEWGGMYTHYRQVYANEFQRYQNGASVLWLAEIPAKGIIAQVFIQLTCDREELANGKTRAYLYSFRVKQEYQGLGIGTYMLEIVEADLVRRGYSVVTLNVAKDNLRAQELYKARKFRIVAHEPGRWSYPDEKGEWQSVEEPAWRMEKRLEPDKNSH
jgi:ribosomal protein S18 acetylase RimI-like enzyme